MSTTPTGSTGSAGIADTLGIDRPRSVAFVHAHPDDETLATGALIVALAADGVACHLLTATRGERGEVVPGSATAAEGSPELVAVREAELAGASRALGLTTQTYLGSPPAAADGDASDRRYTDSGMAWIRPGLAGPGPDATPDAFTAADRARIEADLAAWLEAVAPDLVVSYEADGGYGHPDHVLAHEVTAAVADRLGIPFAEIVPSRAPDVGWYVLDETLDTVTAALHHHRTQLTVEGAEVVHVGGQREPILTSLGLRLRPPSR